MKDLGVKLWVLVESLPWDSPPVGPTDEFSRTARAGEPITGLGGVRVPRSSHLRCADELTARKVPWLDALTRWRVSSGLSSHTGSSSCCWCSRARQAGSPIAATATVVTRPSWPQMPADNVAKRSPDLEAWDECPGQTGRVEGEDSSLCILRARGAATFGKGWLREEDVSQSVQALAGLIPRRGALGPCSGGKPRHQGRSRYTCCPQGPAGMLESLVLGWRLSGG